MIKAVISTNRPGDWSVNGQAPAATYKVVDVQAGPCAITRRKTDTEIYVLNDSSKRMVYSGDGPHDKELAPEEFVRISNTKMTWNFRLA